MDGPADHRGRAARSSAARASATATRSAFDFHQGITQVIDNVSLDPRHARVQGRPRRAVGRRQPGQGRALPLHLRRRSRTTRRPGAAPNPRAYTNFQQLAGDTTAEYDSAFYGFFVQDDWQVTPRLKLLYGVRYDVFDVPSARPFTREHAYRRTSPIDKNNFGPRAGLSWSVDEAARTVVRASAGLMYEPPLLDFYDNAILNNGDPKSFNIGPLLPGGASARPPFPASLASAAARVRPAEAEHQRGRCGFQDAVGVAQQRAGRTRADERRRGDARLRQRDRPEPAGPHGRQPGAVGRRRSPDGRPIYRRRHRRDARGSRRSTSINVFQSIGESTYNAFTATADQAHDARVDDAGDLHAGARGRQRPADRDLRGRERRRSRVGSDEPGSRQTGSRHSTRRTRSSVSAVVAPQVGGTTAWASALLNNNQLGIILQANSGLPFNIRSNLDLNRDGVLNDRPLDVERNAGRLGRVVNLDLRYSRFIPIARRGARGAVLRGEEPVQHREHRRA